MARYILTFASLNGFLVVALGAFGAHALETIVDAKAMGVFETGVQYHLFHTLALLGNGLLAGQYSAQKLFWIPASLFAAGIVLFAGSLYLLSVTGLSWLGAITPIGGLGFLGGGQAFLALFVVRHAAGGVATMTIEITVNGKTKTLLAELSLSDLLQDLGMTKGRIAGAKRSYRPAQSVQLPENQQSGQY